MKWGHASAWFPPLRQGDWSDANPLRGISAVTASLDTARDNSTMSTRSEVLSPQRWWSQRLLLYLPPFLIHPE